MQNNDFIQNYKKFINLKRLPIGLTVNYIQKKNKPMFTDDEMLQLLTGTVLIEEKIDGKTEKMNIPNTSYILFGENVKIRHSVFYDKLPSFFIVYDIYNEQIGQWLHRKEKEQICEQYGYKIVPKIYEGTILDITSIIERYITRKFYSQFASHSLIEGIVIKNYKENLFGKIIRSEFLNGIDTDGDYRNQIRTEKEKYNQLIGK